MEDIYLANLMSCSHQKCCESFKSWNETSFATSKAPKTHRPDKFGVYRNHTRLHVDFTWDFVARKLCNAFGVNIEIFYDRSEGPDLGKDAAEFKKLFSKHYHWIIVENNIVILSSYN